MVLFSDIMISQYGTFHWVWKLFEKRRSCGTAQQQSFALRKLQKCRRIELFIDESTPWTEWDHGIMGWFILQQKQVHRKISTLKVRWSVREDAASRRNNPKHGKERGLVSATLPGLVSLTHLLRKDMIVLTGECVIGLRKAKNPTKEDSLRPTPKQMTPILAEK